jgi:hypothetical protein
MHSDFLHVQNLFILSQIFLVPPSWNRLFFDIDIAICGYDILTHCSFSASCELYRFFDLLLLFLLVCYFLHLLLY